MFPDLNLDEEASSPKVVVTPQEQKVAAIFADLLGSYDFSLNDSFFDLGGHSLMATRLIFNLKQTLDVDLPLEVLLKNPSVKAIASTIVAIKSNPDYKQQTLNLNNEVVLDSLIKVKNKRERVEIIEKGTCSECRWKIREYIFNRFDLISIIILFKHH